MGFRKYAKAAIVKPDIHLDVWNELRLKAAGQQGFAREANHLVLQEYDPKVYLLSHCTIIASVDVEQSDAQLGRHLVDGFQVDRRYADWLVTPETSKYVNNNQDAWERRLLLSCFKTFIGGENYVEHIQIPELSKGKIIDAAARDLGDSIYVDILVATDRRHRPLISAISNRQLQTLSMGCQVEFTICTKCGNVAYDETQLCPHVRYFKGNEYVDALGKKRRIAELCGHITAEPGSVKFIEASWVANPAFTGAVLRNILSPEEIAGLGEKFMVAFSQGPRVPDEGSLLKAARMIVPRTGFGQQDTDVPTGDAPAEPAAAPEDSLAKAVDDLSRLVREKVIEKVREDIGRGEAQQGALPDENRNETIIKSAFRHPEWRALAHRVLGSVRNPKVAKKILLGLILYKRGGWGAVQASHLFTGRDVLAVSRFIDLASSRTRTAGEARIYRVVLAVGGLNRYPDMKRYLAACRQVMGREPTDSEREALVNKGHLFSLGS